MGGGQKINKFDLETVLFLGKATMKLHKTKDNSVEEGRAYVHAYVEYTHTLEALEHVLHGDFAH